MVLLHYLIFDTNSWSQNSAWTIFPSSATNAKKYDGILYLRDAFLGFLLISGSDSKLVFSLHLLEACLSPRLGLFVVLLLSYVEQGFLLAVWNISTSINGLFDIFSQQNQSFFIFVSFQVSIKMPSTLCTFKNPSYSLIFREKAFVACLLQERKYISDTVTLRIALFSPLHLNALILPSDNHIADHSFAYLPFLTWE